MGYNRQYFMEKRLIYVLTFIMVAIGVYAQSAYKVPNFRSADRYTSSKMSAISVEMITPISGDENGYEITFLDSQNVNRAVEQYATSFKFYLSYKGKRISEYQSANSNYKYTFTYKCYVWPGMVPKGNEKYVTAQIGEEPQKRDRRDDSGAAVY
jgi:hypothetical protein